MPPSTTAGHPPRALGFPLIFLVAAVATAVMGFRPSLALTKPGVESPFTYSFNRASEAGQRWGRDYIATYGPYGHLIVTHPVGDLPERRVRFELARIVCRARHCPYVFAPSFRAWGLIGSPCSLLVAGAESGEYRWFEIFMLLLSRFICSARMPSRCFFAGDVGRFLIC